MRTEEERVIKENWGKDIEYIKDWFVNRKPLELKFITRKGYRILQQKCEVTVFFTETISKHGMNVTKDSSSLWFDVPLEN